MKRNIYKNNELYIKELYLKKEIKDQLLKANSQISNFIAKELIIKCPIVIDQYDKKTIDILLEYLTTIIKNYEIYDEIILYDEHTKIEALTNDIIIINDFNIFEEKVLDSWKYKRKINEMFSNIKNNQNLLIITYSGNIEETDLKDYSLFNINNTISIRGNNKKQALYTELKEKYEAKAEKLNISYEDFKDLYEAVINDKYIKEYGITNYLCEYEENRKILECNKNNNYLQELVPKKTTKEKKINALTGLKNIKEEIDSLISFLKYNKNNNLSINDIYLNMFFLGNPGTGKTTVAQLLSKELKELDIIEKDFVKEIIPTDLMGKYVGHTKDTTRKILDEARGGILFIDEAYLIDESISNRNTYMEEALIELLKYIEDPKNIVIFAGYKDRMQKLYDHNPGLKSRIYKEIIFEDYNEEELYEILENNLKNKGLSLEKNSKRKIINEIKKMKKEKDFGNARTMLQLSQKMIMNHSKRSNNLVVDASDLPIIVKQTNEMGFDIYD